MVDQCQQRSWGRWKYLNHLEGLYSDDRSCPHRQNWLPLQFDLERRDLSTFFYSIALHFCRTTADQVAATQRVIHASGAFYPWLACHFCRTIPSPNPFWPLLVHLTHLLCTSLLISLLLRYFVKIRPSPVIFYAPRICRHSAWRPIGPHFRDLGLLSSHSAKSRERIFMQQNAWPTRWHFVFRFEVMLSLSCRTCVGMTRWTTMVFVSSSARQICEPCCSLVLQAQYMSSWNHKRWLNPSSPAWNTPRMDPGPVPRDMSCSLH